MPPEMEIQMLEGLLDEILAGIQELLTSGERLSDELQGMIAEEIEATLIRIDQLRSGEQGPNIDQPQAPDKLRMESPYPSSNVHSFAYDPKKQKLFVRFQDKFPAQNGPVYSYDGVPENIFKIFASGAVPPKTTGRNRWHAWYKGVTPSLGASMNALIKVAGYPYQRVA
jgi:hypothetical protein